MGDVIGSTGFARTVASLCRLRADPADLPYSTLLLGGLIAAGTVLDVLTWNAFGDSDGALSHSLLSTGIVLVLCWAALAICRLGNRFVQTATALMACSLVFSLIQWPVALMIDPLMAADATAVAQVMTPLQVALRWALLVVFVWQVAVDAHIMRKALGASLGLAIALVLAWLLAIFALDRLLFGTT